MEHRHTQFWDRLGASVPLVCAPMGGVAGGELAHAVSLAGGVGMIGLGSSGSPELLAREYANFLACTPPVPIGIGLVEWLCERHPHLLAKVLELRPTLLSVSFGEYTGDAPAWLRLARKHDIPTITQVATVEEAVLAHRSGVDALVARGLEGGGHGDPATARDTLLTGILERLPDTVPVLAAGAITDAQQVRHVRELGASGVWVGTAFTACPESLTNDTNREILLTAGNEDTEVTRKYDLEAGLPWPERFPERVIRETPVNAGMGVGSLTQTRSAEAVVRALFA